MRRRWISGQPLIGRCGLLPWTIDQRQEVEVAYMLAKEYWGQGPYLLYSKLSAVGAGTLGA